MAMKDGRKLKNTFLQMNMIAEKESKNVGVMDMLQHIK